jgi:hypothetical protein
LANKRQQPLAWPFDDDIIRVHDKGALGSIRQVEQHVAIDLLINRCLLLDHDIGVNYGNGVGGDTKRTGLNQKCFNDALLLRARFVPILNTESSARKSTASHPPRLSPLHSSTPRIRL